MFVERLLGGQAAECLAAREAAAFKRGLEAAEEVVMRDWPDGMDGCEAVCDAIRALPVEQMPHDEG